MYMREGVYILTYNHKSFFFISLTIFYIFYFCILYISIFVIYSHFESKQQLSRKYILYVRGCILGKQKKRYFLLH